MNKLIELDIALKFANNKYSKFLKSYLYDKIESNLKTSESEESMLYWQNVCTKIELEIELIIRSNYPQ